MEKTYYVTWIHGNLEDLSDAGLAEIMFNFIQNFLKPRSFKAKVNESVPDTKSQTEGIPHGSVIIHTFFILKINNIVARLATDD